MDDVFEDYLAVGSEIIYASVEEAYILVESDAVDHKKVNVWIGYRNFSVVKTAFHDRFFFFVRALGIEQGR